MTALRRRYLLVLAQGVGRSASTVSVTVAALAGLQLSGTALGGSVIFASNYFGLILAALLFAPLISRYGRRWVYYAAALAGVGAGLLGALSLTTGLFVLLLAAQLLLAGFLSSVNSYRFAILELSPAGSKQQALSLLLFGGIVAALVGPFLARNAGRFLPGQGFEPVYLSLSLLAFATLLLLPLVPLLPPSTRRRRFTPRQYFGLLRQPFFLSIASPSAFSQFVMILMMGAASLHLAQRGESYHTVTKVVQLHVLAMFVPSLVTGKLLARCGVMRMLGSGVLLLLLAGGGGMLWDGKIATGSWLMCVGLGWNFLYTSGSYLVGTKLPLEQRYLGQGVAEANDNVLSALASVLAGLLLPQVGWKGLSAVLALASLLYGCYLFRCRWIFTAPQATG